MATATFSGTYTQNNGEDYATGTVAITPYGGATVTVTLDATGSYSQVVTLVLTSVSGVWVNDAGAIVTSAPASGVQIIPPNGTVDRGKCRVVETITGKPVTTTVYEVADGATVNTGRDVGTVLGGADIALGDPVLSLTYNADGTVATSTENGVTTTYTYNADGTVATSTRLGVTRTFTYSGGNLTAVS